MTTLENLPKELLINILSRLPPDSLFQFIFVNKFWYALIIDPIHSSILQFKHILFMRLQRDTDSRKTQLLLSDLALDPSLSLINHFHLPLPFNWKESQYPFDNDVDFCQILHIPDLDFYETFHIHDHSHGLVCLTDYQRDIILCNLTTREFRKLPPSIIMLTYPSDYAYDGRGNAIGFGYDPKSKDFKVVRIACFMEFGFYYKVEVFDLKEDRWREVEIQNIFDDVRETPSCGIYHEGMLFWVMVTLLNESYTRIIYSFDLSEEVFGQIRVPKFVEETKMPFDNWNYIDMGILKGSIVIFHETWKSNHSQSKLESWILESRGSVWELESTLDIWKMERNHESGVVSWSKSFSIIFNSEIGRPFIFLNLHNLLVIKEEQVSLYNVRTQHFKELPIKAYAWDAYINGSLWGSILKSHGCEATSFGRSLFSVKGEKY